LGVRGERGRGREWYTVGVHLFIREGAVRGEEGGGEELGRRVCIILVQGFRGCAARRDRVEPTLCPFFSLLKMVGKRGGGGFFFFLFFFLFAFSRGFRGEGERWESLGKDPSVCLVYGFRSLFRLMARGARGRGSWKGRGENSGMRDVFLFGAAAPFKIMGKRGAF